MLSNKNLFNKACDLAMLVDLAICRREEPGVKWTVRQARADGTTVRKLTCDFTKAAQLEIMDKEVLPIVKALLDEAERRGMTAVEKLFSAQSLYAIQVKNSVSALDVKQISEILYPPKVEPESLKVLSFPVRQRQNNTAMA